MPEQHISNCFIFKSAEHKILDQPCSWGFMLQQETHVISHGLTWHAPPEKCNYTSGQCSPQLVWCARSASSIHSCFWQLFCHVFKFYQWENLGLRNYNHSINIKNSQMSGNTWREIAETMGMNVMEITTKWKNWRYVWNLPPPPK